MDIVAKIKARFGAKIAKIEERSARRIYLDIPCAEASVMAKFMFGDLGLRFSTATGIDTPSGIEILYHFSCDSTGQMISLRALIIDKNKPEIQSIAPLFAGAEWIEREIWELLGVNFIGHPDLKHLLLIDDWPKGKFPLRKDK